MTYADIQCGKWEHWYQIGILDWQESRVEVCVLMWRLAVSESPAVEEEAVKRSVLLFIKRCYIFVLVLLQIILHSRGYMLTLDLSEVKKVCAKVWLEWKLSKTYFSVNVCCCTCQFSSVLVVVVTLKTLQISLISLIILLYWETASYLCILWQYFFRQTYMHIDDLQSKK